MTRSQLHLKDLGKCVTILPDQQTHIKLKDPQCCEHRCHKKPCTIICPTHVYAYDHNKNRVAIDHTRCVECGACIFACPYSNISWHYPRPGYGVFYDY